MKRTGLQFGRRNFTLILILCILLVTVFTENVSSEAVITISPQGPAAAGEGGSGEKGPGEKDSGEKDSGEEDPGEGSFMVNIYIEPDEAVSGVQFDFLFDSSLVSARNVREGDILKQSGSGTMFSPGSVDNSHGTVTGVYGFILGKNEATAPGTFASIVLTPAGGEGVCELQLSNVAVSDSSGHAVPVRVVNGAVRIGNALVTSAKEPSGVTQAWGEAAEKEFSGEALAGEVHSGKAQARKTLAGEAQPGESSEDEMSRSFRFGHSSENQGLELELMAGENSDAALSSEIGNIQGEGGQEGSDYNILTGILAAGGLCLAALFCLREIKSERD